MSTKTGTVLSIIIFNCNGSSPTIAASAMDLASFSFFQRGSVKEIIRFSSREVVARTAVGQRLCVQVNKAGTDLTCHTVVDTQRLGGAVVTMGPYPQRVAFSLLSKAMDAFSSQYGDKLLSASQDLNAEVKGMIDLLSKYQTPDAADPLMYIDKTLKETTEIMAVNIEKILERGQQMEDLIARSAELSASSKMCMLHAKDLNSTCCIII